MVGERRRAGSQGSCELARAFKIASEGEHGLQPEENPWIDLRGGKLSDCLSEAPARHEGKMSRRVCSLLGGKSLRREHGD
jgi:hypothetical protein